ncbi:phospholipid carrier-dependent glycosyltransferase, partial [bacterium]
MKNPFSPEYRHISIIAFISFLVIYSSSFISGYGYFIDEFYYIACANNPAFGYVDHPPFAPLFLTAYKFIFGESLYAIRFIPALTASVTVFLTGIITKQFGGNKISQTIASFCVFVSPLFATLGSFYSMNVFEPMFCTIVFYLFIKMINEKNPVIWIYIGILFGLLLLNKHTAGLFIVFVIISMVITEHRKLLFTKYFVYSVVITTLIFLPNIIWQIKSGFPSLEFYITNITRKNIPMPAIEYLIFNVFAYNPFVFLLSITGAVFLIYVSYKHL